MPYITSMSGPNYTPETLLEAMIYFSKPGVAHGHIVAIRWPKGVTCPKCPAVCSEIYFMDTAQRYKCRSCKCQFSIRVGTIMEDSPLTLAQWCAAIWLIANAKNGISSWEVSRALGITQKSAWHLEHRIRTAMATGSFGKLSGTVEADETYVGGKLSNMHKHKREQYQAKRGPAGKAVVMGILERHGEVRAKVVRNTSGDTLEGEVRDNVKVGAKLFTDAAPGYVALGVDYVHAFVNHAEEYVRGEVHTNGIENFWSLFKRCYKGTYINMEPAHLGKYVDEQVFRFNNRKADDAQRFNRVLGQITGKRLMYKDLIALKDELPC